MFAAEILTPIKPKPTVQSSGRRQAIFILASHLFMSDCQCSLTSVVITSNGQHTFQHTLEQTVQEDTAKDFKNLS